jgi:hypothetical protein
LVRPAAVERLVQAINQRLLVERFVQETECASVKHAAANFLVERGRYEDHGRLIAVGNQPAISKSCSSAPLMPGIRKSVITHDESSTRPDCKYSSAEE